MKRLSLLAIAGAFVLAMTQPAMAGWLGLGKSVEGPIQNIDKDQIIVTHLDPAQNAISEVAIEINLDTRFEQVGSMDQFKEGDKVKVRYIEDQDKKIATSVARIEPEQQEGTSRLNM